MGLSYQAEDMGVQCSVGLDVCALGKVHRAVSQAQDTYTQLLGQSQAQDTYTQHAWGCVFQGSPQGCFLGTLDKPEVCPGG